MPRLTMLTIMGSSVGLLTGVACHHLALWTSVGAALGLALWKMTANAANGCSLSG
jgi:hypothetical protein